MSSLPRKSSVPPRESDLERRCVVYALRFVPLALKLNGLGARGRSDRVFPLPNGRVLWVEFKRPGKKLDDGNARGQERNHHLLKKLNHQVAVVDNFEDFKIYFRTEFYLAIESN